MRGLSYESGILQIIYVPLAIARRWDRNFKVHDIPTLKASIVMHGFRDPIEYDAALNDGEGGIVSGEGRLEALGQLYDEAIQTPKYLLDAQDGSWLVPIVFGADSDSQQAAEAYGIDANSTVVRVLSEEESSKIWKREGYLALLKDLTEHGQRPATVSSEQLNRWLAESSPIAQTAPDVDETRDRLKAKREPIVKVLILAKDLPLLEEAIAATGHVNNRALALEEIAKAYLEQKAATPSNHNKVSPPDNGLDLDQLLRMRNL